MTPVIVTDFDGVITTAASWRAAWPHDRDPTLAEMMSAAPHAFDAACVARLQRLCDATGASVLHWSYSYRTQYGHGDTHDRIGHAPYTRTHGRQARPRTRCSCRDPHEARGEGAHRASRSPRRRGHVAVCAARRDPRSACADRPPFQVEIDRTNWQRSRIGRTLYGMGRRTHGHSSGSRGQVRHTPEYNAWCNMRGRCNSRKDPMWQTYGGRGIAVCERWHDFSAFLADVGPRPSPQHSLDRINNDGNYEPGNVRWATEKEQQRNRSNNRLITIDGDTKCLAAWCEMTGVTHSAFKDRMKRGWDLRRALFEPMHGVFGSENARSKVTEDQVREMRALFAQGDVNPKKLIETYGITSRHFYRIIRGELWKHVAR